MDFWTFKNRIPLVIGEPVCFNFIHIQTLLLQTEVSHHTSCILCAARRTADEENRKRIVIESNSRKKKRVSERRNTNYTEDNFKEDIVSMLHIGFPFSICLG